MKFGRCSTRTGNALITHPDFQDPRGTNYCYNLPKLKFLRGEIRTHDLRSFLLSQSFLSLHLKVSLKFGVHFQLCCSVLLERLYLFTLYALRCLKAFRNPLTYLGISILQPSPILPNFTWAVDPKPACYQTAPLGVN